MDVEARFFEILKRLADTPGVSGFEDEIRRIIIDELKPLVDEVRVDKFGNVIGVKRGKKDYKVMVAAHMDEIGLMVTHIDKRGFLRFIGVGGWSNRILPGQRVIVHGDKGPVRGVIGVKPPHLETPEEAKQVIDMTKMFIDIGVSSREEAEKLGVRPGCVITLDRELVRLAGSRFTGKSFDDRVGVAVMVYALELLKDADIDANVYAVATVQEEVGLRGATVSAYAINPDIGIAIDVTTASDVPGVEEKDWVTQLGKGPAIKVMDGARTGATRFISHPAIFELLRRAAEEEGIPYEEEGEWIKVSDPLPYPRFERAVKKCVRSGGAMVKRDPSRIEIKFESTGALDCNDILIMAVDELIKKLNEFERLLREQGSRAQSFKEDRG